MHKGANIHAITFRNAFTDNRQLFLFYKTNSTEYHLNNNKKIFSFSLDISS